MRRRLINLLTQQHKACRVRRAHDIAAAGTWSLTAEAVAVETMNLKLKRIWMVTAEHQGHTTQGSQAMCHRFGSYSVGLHWWLTGHALDPGLPGLCVAAGALRVLIQSLHVGLEHRLLLRLGQPLQHLVEHRHKAQRHHLWMIGESLSGQIAGVRYADGEEQVI